MASNNRADRGDTDFSAGVDHYSVQAALALALLVLAVLAALWPRGRRQVGTTTGVCALYLGVLSAAWSGYPGALPSGWAIAAIVWGVALTGWAWLSARAGRGLAA
jgi:hypothetical protein